MLKLPYQKSAAKSQFWLKGQSRLGYLDTRICDIDPDPAHHNRETGYPVLDWDIRFQYPKIRFQIYRDLLIPGPQIYNGFEYPDPRSCIRFFEPTAG